MITMVQIIHIYLELFDLNDRIYETSKFRMRNTVKKDLVQT